MKLFHPSRRLPAASFCLLLVCLFYPSSAAGQHSNLTAGLGWEKGLLGDGDNWVNIYTATLSYRFQPRMAVTGEAAFMQTVRRTPQAAIALDWHDRTFAFADLGLDMTVVRVEDNVGGIHRFSLMAGLSARYRQEEHVMLLSYQGHPRHIENMRESVPNERFYMFRYHDGPGGYQDGGYAMITRKDHGPDLGAVMKLHYSLQAGRFVPGFEVSMRKYSTGTQVVSYGLTLGVAL